MKQDETFNDDFDVRLTRLFAEKNQRLLADEFMQQAISRLEHECHLQWMRRGLAAVVIMLFAAVLAPEVVQGTMGMLSLVSDVKQLPNIDIAMTVIMVLFAARAFLRARRLF